MNQDYPEELSERELEILRLVATGATNQQIALALIISVNTVKAHLRNIFAKLGVESRTEATLYAIQHGLVEVARPADEALVTDGERVPNTPQQAASLPLPRFIHWPLSALQRALMLVALLFIVTVAVWPGAGATSSPAGGRLVDAPKASGPDVEPEHASRWQTKAQMPTSRARFAQAQMDGIIYVVGGLTAQGWSAEVDAYDPAFDRWSRRASKLTAVSNVGAAVVGGLIYVPGGLDEKNVVRDILEVYDPRSDTWSVATSLPAPVCAYAIAAVEDGFYLFGGWDGQRYLDAVYHYQVSTAAWRREASLKVARGFAAAATVGGRIYVVGGLDDTTEFSLCESYDPALHAAGKDPWRTLSPMSQGRAGHGMTISEGYLYVVGGGWDSYLAYNERYDVANDAWSTFESPLLGEWRTLGLSAISAQSGTFLYAIGGWNGQCLSVVQAYSASYRVYVPQT
jgi:DNA-binding CsgD family transcriptional regulator